MLVSMNLLDHILSRNKMLKVLERQRAVLDIWMRLPGNCCLFAVIQDHLEDEARTGFLV